jgi:hypothetical protein
MIFSLTKRLKIDKGIISSNGPVCQWISDGTSGFFSEEIPGWGFDSLQARLSLFSILDFFFFLLRWSIKSWIPPFHLF